MFGAEPRIIPAGAGHGAEPRIYPAEREAEPRIYPPGFGAEHRMKPGHSFSKSLYNLNAGGVLLMRA